MGEVIKKGEYAVKCLENKGFEAFLVGGIVRDSIMGRDCHDADVTTNARPEEVKAVFQDYRVIETGLKHGTVTVIIDKVPIEITTYRTEQGYSDSRHPDKVMFANDIIDDLSRRDFTMNSIAYNPDRGYVDPFGGKNDIENKLIKCVGVAEKRFDEDALRVLRAVRFSSELGFSIEKETSEAALQLKNKLNLLSKERIASELLRLLCGKDVKRVLLDYVDILSEIFPNLKKMQGFNQCNFHHCFDILEHTATVVENIRPEPYMRLAALLHDYGKPECFSVSADGVGHFYSHASIGAELALSRMKELKLENNTIDKVHKLIRIHDSPIEADEPTIKRKLNKYGEQTLRDLIELQRADNFGQSEDFRFRQKHFDELESILNNVLKKNECFSVKSLAVNGNDMKSLGFIGKEIGDALNILVDAVIDNKVENVKEKLVNYILVLKKFKDI